MFKKDKFTLPSIIINLLVILLLAGCQSTTNTNVTKKTILSSKILSSTVSVNFAPDGRLWRLIPYKQAIYVDFSNDKGKTYSNPVRINKFDQKISAWPENPPAIKISASGRVNVLYFADEKQISTSFYSYSDDNGQTFSIPVLVSDYAQTAMHYMDKMLIDKDDNLLLFWHDTRHELHDKESGTGALSLYYSVKNSSDNSEFNNHFLSSDVCSCCRTAISLTTDGKPVVLARMVYSNGVRDHALIRMNSDNTWLNPQRVTYDNWEIEACPEHGPAISIDSKNRSHIVWFTLGDTRKGIFYAQTDDFGKNISDTIALGNSDYLPSHPDVITLKQRVIIVWKEFDGEQTSLHIKESNDRGISWVDKATMLSAKSKNSHPKLIADNNDIFLSWTSKIKGHQIIKL